MVRLSKETREYLRDYIESLNGDNNAEKDLYLKVIDNALEYAKDEDNFYDLLSYGNRLVVEYGLKKNPPKDKLILLDEETKTYIMDGKVYSLYPEKVKSTREFKLYLNSKMKYESNGYKSKSNVRVETPSKISYASDVEEELEEQEKMDAVRRAYLELPLQEHICVRSVIVENNTYNKTSRTYGIDPEGVRRSANNGIMLLQQDEDIACYRGIDKGISKVRK